MLECKDGYNCSDAVPHRLAITCNAPTLPCYCVHRRARWRAPPWGTQRRTRHRRMTTVSSTSSFRRRGRRGRLLGRQAAGRGSTFGAGCTARRAASAPSPPHLHSTRALSAIDPCCGNELARLGSPRAQLLRSARASRRTAKGARAGRWQMERRLGAAPSSDAPGAGCSGAEGARVGGVGKKRRKVVRNKGGPSQYPGKVCCAALAFFRVPTGLFLLDLVLAHFYAASIAFCGRRLRSASAG